MCFRPGFPSPLTPPHHPGYERFSLAIGNVDVERFRRGFLIKKSSSLVTKEFHAFFFNQSAMSK